MKTKTKRAVIVTTEYRGVFFGFSDDTTGDTIALSNARMAISWGTTNGLFELAERGPNAKSKISAKADIEIRKITAVLEVTEAALAAWQSYD